MSSKKRKRNLLDGVSSYRADRGLTPLVIREFLTGLDCPRALTVLLLYENKEHEQLAKLEIDPLSYAKASDFADAYAATKLLSKFKRLSLNYSRRKVALEKFESFELLCKQTNTRFRHLSTDSLFKGPVVWLHNAVIQKVEWILGDFLSEEFFDLPDWGPGASTLIKRREASKPTKFQLEAGVTRELLNLIPLGLLKEKYPQWAQHLESNGFPRLQEGNKIITVAKDATTDRVIAVEPGINLWFQKSVGEMIRRRLLRVGIDLRYQSRNQNLARIGSKYQKLATVDLSSASDSISRAVVQEIIPAKWFTVMDACRSHFGVINKREKIVWEKFSSMGNGFTFGLETLIFYAVAKACAEYLHLSRSVGVYGDDVILPTSAIGLFATMMEFYGFRMNEKKTHFASTFRESCGAHYFGGIDVKPIYLKDRLSDLSSIFSLANAIRLYAHRRCGNLACDVRFQKAYHRLVAKVPRALRFKVPKQLGDVGFISCFDEATPARLKDGLEGFYALGVMKVRKGLEYDKFGYLLAELWRLDRGETLVEVDVESENLLQVSLQAPTSLETIDHELFRPVLIREYNTIPLGEPTYRLVKGEVREWPDLGPWI